jgi:hypothetical protein
MNSKDPSGTSSAALFHTELQESPYFWEHPSPAGNNRFADILTSSLASSLNIH